MEVWQIWMLQGELYNHIYISSYTIYIIMDDFIFVLFKRENILLSFYYL